MRLSCLLLTLFLPFVAQAESWVDIAPLGFEIDADSVQADAAFEDTVNFQYRFYSDKGYVKFTSSGRCGNFMVETKRVVDSDSNGKITRISDYENDPVLMHQRFLFVGYTSSSGQALRYACDKLNSPAWKALTAPKKTCSDNEVGKIECSNFESWRVNFRVFSTLTDESRLYCQAPVPLMSRLYAEVVMDVSDCTDERCGNKALEIWISRLGADVLKVIDKQVYENVPPDVKSLCSSVTLAQKDIEMRQKSSDDLIKREAARHIYYQCVGEVIPKLDDKTSGADVIAKGAHGACKTQFFDYLATTDVGITRQDEVYKIIEPKLIEAVLVNRVKQRQKKSNKTAL